jgi:hypothetical protein
VVLISPCSCYEVLLLLPSALCNNTSSKTSCVACEHVHPSSCSVSGCQWGGRASGVMHVFTFLLTLCCMAQWLRQSVHGPQHYFLTYTTTLLTMPTHWQMLQGRDTDARRAITSPQHPLCTLMFPPHVFPSPVLHGTTATESQHTVPTLFFLQTRPAVTCTAAAFDPTTKLPPLQSETQPTNT